MNPKWLSIVSGRICPSPTISFLRWNRHRTRETSMRIKRPVGNEHLSQQRTNLALHRARMPLQRANRYALSIANIALLHIFARILGQPVIGERRGPVPSCRERSGNKLVGIRLRQVCLDGNKLLRHHEIGHRLPGGAIVIAQLLALPERNGGLQDTHSLRRIR